NLEYFKKNDIEVLYLYEEIDDFLMPDIGEYEGKKLVGTDKADLKIEKEDEEDALSDTSKEGIIKYFKDTLGDRVGDVIESKRLIDSACTLVSPKDAMNAHMERMMKSMNQDFVGAKKILEINLSNSLIKNLSKIQETKPEDELLKECVEQIFESASLLDGSLENPSLMVPRTMDIMGKAADLYLKSLD
ncbi:MAG: HSP90 family molecular chaperone, partial [bacterium]